MDRAEFWKDLSDQTIWRKSEMNGFELCAAILLWI